jgi:hypothetical protein
MGDRPQRNQGGLRVRAGAGKQPYRESTQPPNAAYKRSWRDFFRKEGENFTKKEKEPKRKERGALWKLPQPWKSATDACGDIFLMISTAA